MNPPEPPDFIAVVGPTGSGKSALAMALAEALGGEIISCDSVQLYRGFDIGSAKPTAAERQAVPHHLIDVLDWREDCDAARYAAMARAAVAEVRGRGKVPLVTGGTGLYLRALQADRFHADLPKDEALRAALRQRPPAELYRELAARDPARAARIHPHDTFRVVRALELLALGRPLAPDSESGAGTDGPALRPFLIVLNPPRAELHRRISLRTSAMLEAGLVEEVRRLRTAGVDPACKPMGSIGYAQVSACLDGRLAPADLPALIDAATRQYAKRQINWFRPAVAALRLETWEPAAVIAAIREGRSTVPGMM